MQTAGRHRHRAFTLLELSLVVGLMVLITAIVVPNFIRQIKGQELERSAKQLRSLLTLVRANAAFDGQRYRVRFPEEADDITRLLDDRQPIIEREYDPIHNPEVFGEVKASWTLGHTLLGDVWCAEVRLGRPTIAKLKERQKRAADRITREMQKRNEEFAPERLPVYFDPDGSSEWAVFVLTTAPRDIDVEDLDNYPRLELIADGATGLAWIQRPFYDEELDLFEEKGWPAVLRQDYVSSQMLTEDDVLEIRESGVRGVPVEKKGRKMRTSEASP